MDPLAAIIELLCRISTAWTFVALVAVLSGCAITNPRTATDRMPVSRELETRFGQNLAPSSGTRETIYPHGISLDNVVTEEQAVLLALSNNAAFLEMLADLGMAQGDLVQAGLLPNPELVYYFPADGKPFKYLFDFPLESLWL